MGATNISESRCEDIQVTDLFGERLDWRATNLENIARLYTCSDLAYRENDLERLQVVIADFPGAFVETYVNGGASVYGQLIGTFSAIKGVVQEIGRLTTTCRENNWRQRLLGGFKGIELKYGYEVASFHFIHLTPWQSSPLASIHLFDTSF